MSHRICLTSNPAASGFPTDRSALWVHHRSDAPKVARSCEVDTFVKNPRTHYAGADVVVLLNLVSKMIRPGSRLKYGQFLTDPWNGPPRISVDTHLYVGLPWRMWFHFGAVDAPFGEPEEKYHTSYRVETDWSFFIESKGPNPCTMDRIRRYGDGVIQFDGGFRFVDPVVRVVAMSDETKHAYQKEKAAAFDACKTPASLLTRLGEFAQRACPERSIPRDQFAEPTPCAVFTDLGIDQYLAGRWCQNIELTNAIAAEFSARPTLAGCRQLGLPGLLGAANG